MLVARSRSCGPTEVPEGVTPIAAVSYRQRARVAGRVRSLRVQPWAGVATLECRLVDNTGGIALVFLGRKHVAGLAPGVRVVAEGMVGDHGGRLAILNPELPDPAEWRRRSGEAADPPLSRRGRATRPGTCARPGWPASAR